jgi:phosphoglycolate phosphatase
MSKLRAVVCDLDGTLIDSAPDLRAAANQVLEAAGRKPLGLAEIRRMIGDGTQRLVERAFAATGGVPADLQPHFERFLSLYEANPTALTKPYPGVETTLARLREAGLTLAICTNKPARATGAVLAGLGLARHFSVVIGGDSLPMRKPDPRILIETLARLAVGADEAAMVGDNEHDVATARAAKVRMVLVSYGYARVPLDALAPDARIDRFDELPAALAGLRGLQRPPPGPP